MNDAERARLKLMCRKGRALMLAGNEMSDPERAETNQRSINRMNIGSHVLECDQCSQVAFGVDSAALRGML